MLFNEELGRAAGAPLFDSDDVLNPPNSRTGRLLPAHRHGERRRRHPHPARRSGGLCSRQRAVLHYRPGQTTIPMQSHARRSGLRARGVRAHRRRRSGSVGQLSFDQRRHRRAVRRVASTRVSRSCASRASTGRSKWRRRSTRRASNASMCTCRTSSGRHRWTVQGIAACGGFSYGDVLGAGAGPSRSCSTTAPAISSAPSSSARHLHPRGLQRLPDAVQPEVADPGRSTGRIRAQPLRAVRGALRDGRGASRPVDPARRHGGFASADRGRAWRGQGRISPAQSNSVRSCPRWPCAISRTTAVDLPCVTRPIPTARLAASPACAVRTAASRS